MIFLSSKRSLFVPEIIVCHDYWMHVNDSGVLHLRTEIDLFINMDACLFILAHKQNKKPFRGSLSPSGHVSKLIN